MKTLYYLSALLFGVLAQSTIWAYHYLRHQLEFMAWQNFPLLSTAGNLWLLFTFLSIWAIREAIKIKN